MFSVLPRASPPTPTLDRKNCKTYSVISGPLGSRNRVAGHEGSLVVVVVDFAAATDVVAAVGVVVVTGS